MLLGAGPEVSGGACSDGGNGEVLDSAKVTVIFAHPREVAQLFETTR
jgi:hypothetical protein